MARIRSIKPKFARHAALQRLEIANPGLWPMLHYACLWMVCDREGRFEWDPEQLKLDILPFLPCDIAQVLELLTKNGYLIRYEVDGKTYGCVKEWAKHQKPNVKESQSSIPAPPEHVKARESTCQHVKARGEVEVEVEVEREREREDAVRDGSDLAVRLIAGSYPPWHRTIGAAGVPQAEAVAIIQAIEYEAKDTGMPVEEAAKVIHTKTAQVAKIVAEWPEEERKYLPQPVRFFHERQYNKQPDLWVRGSPKKKQVKPMLAIEKLRLREQQREQEQRERANGSQTAIQQ